MAGTIIVIIALIFLIFETIKTIRRIKLFILSRRYARQYMREAHNFIDYSEGLKIVN